jgi:hypothetical protein
MSLLLRKIDSLACGVHRCRARRSGGEKAVVGRSRIASVEKASGRRGGDEDGRDRAVEREARWREGGQEIR